MPRCLYLRFVQILEHLINLTVPFSTEDEQPRPSEKLRNVGQFTSEGKHVKNKARRSHDENTFLRLPLRKRANKKLPKTKEDIPTIYAITPTYKRFLQKAELTRICNTFLHIKNFHWILVEDSRNKTKLVASFLSNCGVKYTHLNVRTPKPLRRSRKQPRWAKSRGVEQRNLGLEWIRQNVNPNKTKGVIYFADDDNTYDLRLFDEVSYFVKVKTDLQAVGFSHETVI